MLVKLQNPVCSYYADRTVNQGKAEKCRQHHSEMNTFWWQWKIFLLIKWC